MSNDGRLGKGKPRKKLTATQKAALKPQRRRVMVVAGGTGKHRMIDAPED
jgi:hypothetical protein